MEKNRQQIRIGSRESKLAVVQSKMVQAFIAQQCPQAEVLLVTMKTTGDKILDKTLDKIGGKGLFVKELDKALLERRTDLSVHSLKDMPMEESKELPLIAFSKREDERDVLVLPKGVQKLDKQLPLGCSSKRRILQLQRVFPEMTFAPVRGNLQTRLAKLDAGQYSGLILAAAGLKRLGLTHRISRTFSTEEVIPSAGQGILAVQGRNDQDYSYLKAYDDPKAHQAALAERAFVRTLNAGSSSPVAAHASITEDQIVLTGLYCEDEGDQWLTGSLTGSIREPEKLGQKLAEVLKERFEKGERT